MVETGSYELFTMTVYQPGSGLQGLLDAITSINTHCLAVLGSYHYFSKTSAQG